jgi:hypothetical protein
MLADGNIINARDEPFLTCTDDSTTFPDAFIVFMSTYGICGGSFVHMLPSLRFRRINATS